MVNSRLLISVVTATASIVLMPVTNWLDGSLNLLTSPALAIPTQTQSKNFSYVPPQRGMPRRTQGAGSRGCTESQAVELALLVPNDHTAETLSGHPTFSWYVSTLPSEPLEFALVESGVAEPIFVKQLQLQKAGIVQLEMPKNLPELVPGKEYRWSVTLICNAERRSNDTFAQSWIKRVPRPPALEQQLGTATTERDRALAYAEAGLWYDAIDTLIAAQTSYSTNSSIREDFLALLEQAGVPGIPMQAQQRLAKY